MADVARFPGIAAQVRLIAGLRWRLLRNSLHKKNNLLDLIGLILAGLFAAVFIFGIALGFFAGAHSFLSTGHSGRIALLFWGIFLFWQLAPIFLAGFGAGFEFRNLLRFPLSLPAFYLIGLAYGFVDLTAIASLCWLAAMTLGAASSRPGVLPAMLLVVALFVLMNVTLERLLGSWLERLLARRRARELFFGLFILSMVSLQFVAPALERYGDVTSPGVTALLPYLSPLPASLAGRAVEAAADSNLTRALLSMAGLASYVLLFGGLLWRRSAAQFGGQELSETPAHVRAIGRRKSIEQMEQPETFLLLSPQLVAVLRKEFHYLTRNGFVSLLLLLPPVLILLLSWQVNELRSEAATQGISADFLFPGMMAYLILVLMAPSYNCFAYEGKGVQSYYMAPVRFREVFLGKNLLLILVLAPEIALSMLILAWRVGLPSTLVLVSTLAALVFVISGQLSIANWSSLSFPRKLEFGQMRGQRPSGMAVLIVFGVQILLGAIITLVLFAGRWTDSPWLPAEAFAILAAAAISGYIASLDALTLLAEKKKETLLDALCR